MGRMRVVLKCEKCGSEEVVVEKIIEYTTRDDLDAKILAEVMCHDGVGWDLSSFTVKCARCGAKIEKVSFVELD